MKKYCLILEVMCWHSQNYKTETNFRLLGEIYLGDGTVFILDTENQCTLRNIII